MASREVSSVQKSYDTGRNRKALSSYNKMILYFWIWDINKFVEDREAFNIVKKWG